MDKSKDTGLILFGHGARDVRWREPFDRLLAMVRERHPGPVSLAFLDSMSPDLVSACKEVVASGAESVVDAKIEVRDPQLLEAWGRVHNEKSSNYSVADADVWFCVCRRGARATH